MEKRKPSEARIVDSGAIEQPASEEKGKEKEVHPLAAFLALHGIDAGDHDDDNDNSEDEEWQPHVRWHCTNCTMPNSDEEMHCSKCKEHRNSGILEQGFMAPSSHPLGMLFKEDM